MLRVIVTTALIAAVPVSVFGTESAEAVNETSVARTTLVDPTDTDWNEVASPAEVRFLLIHDMPDFMSNKSTVLKSQELATNLLRFTDLKALYLLAPAVSDDVVDALKGVSSLEAIALVDVQLSQEGALRLLQALPKLRTLALWNSDVVDVGALRNERADLSVELASEGMPSTFFDQSGCASGKLFSAFDAVATATDSSR